MAIDLSDLQLTRDGNAVSLASATLTTNDNRVYVLGNLQSLTAVAGVYPTAAFKFLIAIGRIMVSRLRRSNQRYVDSLLFPLAGKD